MYYFPIQMQECMKICSIWTLTSQYLSYSLAALGNLHLTCQLTEYLSEEESFKIICER